MTCTSRYFSDNWFHCLRKKTQWDQKAENDYV